MRYFLAPFLLFSIAIAADVGMNIHGGAYKFGYATGDAGGHSRVESGQGGNIAGSYSYIDANGDRRTVQYTAGPQGFHVAGDIGVDRKTAAAAAALAAMAPKAPVAAALAAMAPKAPVAAAPIASYSSPVASYAAPVPSYAAPVNQWYNPTPYHGANVIVSSGGYSAKW